MSKNSIGGRAFFGANASFRLQARENGKYGANLLLWLVGQWKRALQFAKR